MRDHFPVQDPRQIWARHIAQIGSDKGFFQRIGRRHAALFVQGSETLVLSFDRMDRLWTGGIEALPLGFDMVHEREWSLLSVMSVGRTWFNDAQLETFLFTLANTGFFKGFDRVVIVASGPDCGHAAARLAARIRGTLVLLARPVAAIGAERAPFETRFRADRRDHPDRPPAGAEALSQAARALVLFDPKRPTEAAQAALFHGARIARIALPHGGAAIDLALRAPEVLVPCLDLLADGALTPAKLRAHLRPVMRQDADYLARLHAARR